MQKMAHIVRKYPLSLLCLALIALLSFTPFFPETPLDDVAFIDKWTHLVMYGGTTSVIWWEYLRTHQQPSVFSSATFSVGFYSISFTFLSQNKHITNIICNFAAQNIMKRVIRSL